jgi:L-lactate dehydrogenase complex protein LldF
MKPATGRFRDMAREAVQDEALHRNLRIAAERFKALRDRGFAGLSDPEGARERGRAVKERSLSRLPELLRQLEQRVTEAGGVVHWARDDREAREIIHGIARSNGVKSVVKGKSMMTEEIGINASLLKQGIEVWETDLGEFIVQLAGEAPSHIIAPAIHLNRQDVGRLFAENLDVEYTENPEELTMIARRALREKFLNADMGITGGNMAVAETGTLVLFENEGNIRFSTSLPRVHVALIGIEKVIGSWEDFHDLLQLLPRSAAGQKISTYVSLISGPRRPGEKDGPEAFHLILLDNGRSRIMADENLREMLYCVRCGACMNVCPVYQHIGGYTYGWVYSGPIGALLNTQLLPPGSARDLPFASTLCGACAEVCPVKIDHPKVMLYMRWRMAEDPTWKARHPLARAVALKAYSRLAGRPALFRAAAQGARRFQSMAGPSGKWPWLPKGLARWGRDRRFPVMKEPFSGKWARREWHAHKTVKEK